MKSVVVIFFILSLVAGRSRAAFGDCYPKCLQDCAAEIPEMAHLCLPKCLVDCLYDSYSTMDSNHMDTHYFCKLGCATSLCTKFSTYKDPAVKNVERCVNSCGQTCMNDGKTRT